ncbi:hypothetical protein [Anaerobacillus alkaliphilus]|uniref:hypothetical protein n=1 Tax=Anaerobacillus alkaliphilus TaxID=1548597 RepID=UPI0018AB11B2|nr:hypothetical protein [Anaerobacillus alkaliphilus]
MGEIIILFITLIPLYIVLIWTYFNPEESMLYGQRWMYKEQPEFSKRAIKYTKFVSVNFIVLLTTFLIGSFFFDNYRFRLIFALGVFVYIGYLIFFKLRSEILKSDE